jgi:hypothetical protein
MHDFKKSLGLEANTIHRDQLQMRWNHLEQRRKEKIKVIKEERAIIIMEEANGEWNPPALSGISGGSSGKKGVSMQMGGFRATTSGQSSPSKFQGSNGFAGTTSVQ